MQKRNRPPADAKTFAVGIEEAASRYGVGRATMRKIAEDSGAVIRLGRRYLVHLGKVDRYLDALAGSD